MRLLVLAFALVPATALAEPTVELVDHGASLEVIAHGLTASKPIVSPTRSRLEVPVVGAPALPRFIPTGDKSVVQIELEGSGSSRRLSVKLGHSRETVAALAPHAKAVQVGDDLHVLIPRTIPTATAPIELPSPTVAAPVATVAAPPPAAPATAMTPPAPSPVAPVQPEPEPEPEPEPAPLPPPPTAGATTTTAPVATKPSPESARVATAPSVSNPLTNPATLLTLGLALVGCVVWVKRRKKPAAAGSSIEVLAQRSLGGKARVVWLQAGPRELIVAVTPQQVRVLGQWKTGEAPAAPMGSLGSMPIPLPRAITTSDAPGTMTASSTTSSPAVSGLLKLRERLPVRPLADDIATGDIDADAEWAREIIAATTAVRG